MRTRWAHGLARCLLMGVGVLLTLTGCGALNALGNPLGYPTPVPQTPIAVAPASSLSVDFRIDLDPLDGTAATRHGTLFVTISTGQEGVLTPDHSLRCEGHDMLRGPGASVAVPPPSGAYTCIYTDERGQQTTLHVRPPTGDLRILSPARGATLHIPGPLPGPPVATPTDAPGATPAAQLPRPAGLVSAPPIPVRYAPLTLPADASEAQTNVHAEVRGPTVRSDEAYALVASEDHDMTGVVSITDKATQVNRGFDTFAPGDGRLDLFGYVQWRQNGTDFATVQVSFNYVRMEPISWVRS